MTNSHFIGFVTFFAFAFFAYLAWRGIGKRPTGKKDQTAKRRGRYMAVFLLVLGAGGGYGAFALDNAARITTLQEKMVEGNLELGASSPVPVRTVTFVVEHPGVVHELFLSPTANLLHPPQSDVEITYCLRGPDGIIILPEATELFEAREATRRNRADWEGHTVKFTPTNAGFYTLELKPLTVGIPRIHVLITDPKKQDGKRMPGY